MDLLAGDHMAWMGGEEGEDSDRLRREVDEHSGLAQFPGFEVKLEDPEMEERSFGGALSHCSP